MSSPPSAPAPCPAKCSSPMRAVRAALSRPRSATDVTAPPGVRVSVWARGLSAPTALAFGPDGRLYVAEVSGLVLALADRDGNGAAETQVTFASGLASPLGLAF